MSDEVKEFLMYLAKHADSKRLFPFPDAYRVDPKVIDKALPAKLQPYTQNDENNLVNAIKTADDRAMKYIMDIPMEIAFHEHSIHPNILEYQFRYRVVKERLRDTIASNRWYLFHGTALGNWHSIIRNGICNMSQTSLMTNGAASGSGVYLTDNLQTALLYTSGSVKCVAIVEVFEDPKRYLKHGGVYVIANDKLIIPRYLYKIRGTVGHTGKDVLAYYKKQTDMMLARKSPSRRMMYEMKELSNLPLMVVLSISNQSISVAYDNIVFEILTQGFPFKRPIIRSVYKLDKKLKNFDEQMIYQHEWLPSVILATLFSSMQLEHANMTSEEIILNYDY